MVVKELKNVHEFDHKLEHNFKVSKKRNNEEKEKIIDKIIDEYEDNTIKNILKIIQKDIQTLTNYDDKNHLNPIDILIEIYLSKNFKNIKLLLEEQLKDMYLLGFCPQGRSIRFLQLWLSIND